MATLRESAPARAAAPDAIVPQPRNGSACLFPASFSQERLWFFSELDPTSPYYNQTLGIRATGRLDLAAFERAVAAVVSRHEMLRTTFTQRDGRLCQRVLPSGRFPAVLVDVTDLPPAQRETCRRRLVASQHQRPFDLERGPLLRRMIVRVSDDDWFLSFAAHHIVTDFSGLAVFLAELGALYAASTDGRVPALPELPVQYGDFAVWHRDWMRGPHFNAQLDYWVQQLAGAEPLRLPTDFERPATPTFRGGVRRWSLDPAAIARLRAIAREENATLFMALLAVFKATLTIQTSQTDLSVGIPIANRQRPETQSLVGFFANTLVLRTSTAGDPSFREILRRVRAVCLGAYRHQDLPFERLVETLHPERARGRNPLFGTMFRLESYAERFPPLRDVRFERTWDDDETSSAARFDLEMAVKELSDGYSATLEYSTDLFAEATVERMTRHFDALLARVTADPDRSIWQHDVLPADERRLLTAWQSGPDADVADGCVHDLIDACALRHRDRPAVRCGERFLTYGDLSSRTNQVAARLRRLGVDVESRVGVCMEPGIDMVVALLAVLKAGAAYVPLDPGYPRDRLAYMLDDARVEALLTHSATRGLVPECAARIVDVDADRDAIDGESRAPVMTGACPSSLIYVIYTSGSTGRPKGAMNAHRAVVNRLCWMQEALQLTHADRVLQKTPYSFDVSVWEFFWPLMVGSELVIAPPGSHRDPGELIDTIVTHGITTIHFVPSMLATFLNDPAVARCESLRRIVCSGEALPGDAVDRCHQLLPGAALYNLYGPTEAAVDVTWWRCERGRKVSIGRPISNVRTYVLTPGLTASPIGGAGELCIGGEAVGRGYLHRPSLTAEKFVPDPFGAPGQRVYRTGDLVRWGDGGLLEYMGRIDRQIKLRGQRIELGEIEAALAQHPAVASATALVQTRDEGDSRIVAFVMPSQEFLAGQSQFHDERVSEWRSVWTQTYEDGRDVDDPAFNTVGWRSSYTGENFSAAEMREWLDGTVSRVLALRPSRVLEIGCGTGLLLARIAPACVEYCGTDFARPALDYLRAQILPLVPDARVSLVEADAARVAECVTGPFDAIVLNSVVQYFPSLEYLERVLDAVIPLVTTGAVLLGDIRSLPLLDAQHASVAMATAPDDLGAVAIAERWKMTVECEEELVVHPAFFASLAASYPAVTHVEILPKRGRCATEMNRFRCDVILHVGGAAQQQQFERQIAWPADLSTSEALRHWLAASECDSVIVTGIPNRRVIQDVEAARLLSLERGLGTAADVRRAVAAAALGGLDPEDVWEAGERAGYHTTLSWLSASGDGAFDAGFVRAPRTGERRAAFAFPGPERRPRDLATAPVRQRAVQRLATELRAGLSGIVPPHLVPSVVVPLPTLPVTPNGKLDRQALARLAARVTARSGSGTSPRTAVEMLLAGIWSDVLQLDHVGIDDDFFDLGGHSLLATQLIARVRQTFKVHVSLQSIFQARTIRALAQAIETDRRIDSDAAPPLVAQVRRDEAPLSFAQQRLYFLEQVLTDRSAYNMSGGVRLRGPFSLRALRRAVQGIVARHEVLRTGLTMRPGEEPVQVIDPEGTVAPRLCDLTAIEPIEAALRRIACHEARQPFDLARAPLLRVAVIHVGDAEHVLLLTMHHVASDGWSIAVLLRELLALYRAAVANEPASLPSLPLQYADFAIWQRQWLRGEVLERQLAYWRQQLKNVPELTLPHQRPRGAVASTRGARVPVTVPAALAERLRHVSRQEGVTPFMTLLAAFQVMLSRYSGQRDVTVGTDVANRSYSELEHLIGFFVNQLALRSTISCDESWRALLHKVRETTLAAYAHQDLPFEQVVKALAPNRDLSRAPLFQVKLVLQNAPVVPFEFPGIDVEPFDHGVVSVKVDLQVLVEEGSAGEMRAAFEYAVDLFDEAMVRRMAADWLVLLEELAADPARTIGGATIVAEPERRVSSSIVREPPVTSWQPVFARVSAHAAARPTAVAIECGARRLTYRALELRANQLAWRLRSLGVGPEVRVALLMERSVDLVVAVFGVLKAGGAYVPLDPAYPPERLAYLLEDAGATLIVTHAACGAALPPGHSADVDLDRDQALLEREPAMAPPVELHPDHPAYVIYTSGSTGQPKGVVVTHENVRRLLATAQPHFNFDDRDVWTLFHSYAFDFSVWEMWGALAFGGRLVVVTRELTRSPHEFHTLLADAGVTVLNQTPSAFQQLLAVDLERPDADLRLRYLIFGGEALDVASLSPWFERHGSCPRLVNMYGITETTVHVTFRELTAEDVELGSVIGQPLADLRCLVLDADLRPVPVAVAGELYVSGPGLARGYLGRPGLTASRYLPHPQPTTPGERAYRTGDVVRWRDSGELEYLGRTDHQVKIRGFRVELGEIEHALATRPDVRSARVLLRGDASQKQLVGYVIPARRGEFDRTAALADLAARLPAYMVPSALVPLEVFPVTSQGKLDVAALPLPTLVDRPLSGDFAEPRTAVEQTLAAIWSDVLHVPRVGLDDDYFALGGDSMLSLQLRTRAAAAGLSFSVTALFSERTIRRLALRTSTAREGEGERAAFSTLAADDRERIPDGVEDAYPLSYLQAGMLFESELKPGSRLYRDIFSHHLQVRFDAGLLRDALDRMSARHPALRTCFDLSSFSEPLQLVRASSTIPCDVVDLRSRARAEQEAVIGAWLEGEKVRPFEPRQPPLRVTVHRRSDEGWQFTLSFHHAILDGWSVAVFVTELFEWYCAALEGKLPDHRPAPPPLFREFVRAEREAVRSEETRAAWRERLRDAPQTILPRWLDQVSWDEAGDWEQVFDVPVDAELSEALRRTARSLAVPLKSVLLAAHVHVLGLLTGSDEVQTGVLVNGRPEAAEGERVLGLFLNNMPFRVQTRDKTFAHLIRRVADAEHGLLPHRLFPLAEMQRIAGGPGLYETTFNFVHFHVYDRVLDRLAVLGGTVFEQTEYVFSANFALDPLAERVRLMLKYQARELSRTQIEAIGGYYHRTLAAIAAAVNAPLEQHDIIGQVERQRTLLTWNETPALPPWRPVVDSIAVHAAATPHATAVTCEGRRLPYGELDARANQLAHCLRALGVGTDVRVGICLQRGIDAIVAILGTLKAGGAYVPLDPSYPPERLAAIVGDAAIGVVITHAAARDAVPMHWAQELDLDRDAAILADAPATAPTSALVPEQLAYVIYTSGSTGVPKGVAITHGQLAASTAARLVYYEDEVRSFLLIPPLAFDSSVATLFWTLAAGGALVVASERERPDPAALARLCRENHVTHVLCLPALYDALLGAAAAGELDTLAAVIVAGEPCPQALVIEHARRAPAADLFNEYGPTECTVWATVHRCEASATFDRVPIGRPIPGTQVYVQAKSGHAVPVGVEGELLIGGAGVARGYLDRPALTAERFLPDAYSPVPGSRVYRTGDRARWLPGGVVDFLGRADRQVKINGYRVELGDVEAAIARHASVSECAVVAAGAPARLVAYVETDEANLRAIHEDVRRRVPAFMVPGQWVALERLPRSVNGKVNYRALPDAHLAPAAGHAHRSPRTHTERLIANIWSHALGVDSPGLDDDFFRLGGHSLVAIRVIARLREVFHPDLPLQAVFDATTLEALAAYVDTAQRERIGPPAPAIGPVTRVNPMPLSFAQQRLWLADQMNAGTATYNCPGAVRLEGALNLRVLRRTVRALVQRHESLRTTFVEVEGELGQVIHPSAAVAIPCIDLTGLPVDVRERETLRLAQVEATQPFDLASGPMFRAWLVRLTAVDHLLLFDLHHIVCDGWSVDILLNEFEQVYVALGSGRDTPLDTLPLQYADYAAWQRQWLEAGGAASHLDYWRERAPSLVHAPLPTDYPRRDTAVHPSARLPIEIGEATVRAARDLTCREGTTLFVLCLAAFHVALARVSRTTAVTTGSPVANRDRPELAGIVGPLVNYLVLQSQVEEDPPFLDLLHALRRNTIDAYLRQDLPFEYLLKLAGAPRAAGVTPLYQAWFVLHRLVRREARASAGLVVEPVALPVSTSRLDLAMELIEAPHEIRGALTFASDLFSIHTARRLADAFVSVLADAVRQPHRPISALAVDAMPPESSGAIEMSVASRLH